LTEHPSVLDREIAIEQAHVDLVYSHLGKATKSARQAASRGRALYQTDRTSFLREEDGTALFERDAFAFQAAKRLATLDAEHEGLVFGRIDLGDGEVRYIGRIGVRDADYEPLVIDWRARAAEPFYRATANDPMEVVRRRVLRCRNERVIGIEDDLLDASHGGELKRARGPQMRDIVATIQGEQDKAIRAEASGVTVIAGGPGTGKTVVALHRAAYLLYSNRRRFERGGILVVGPSSVFMNYIERVLPSLGEDSVTLRAIGAVAEDVLGFAADRNDDAPAAAIKGSLRMVDLLKRLVNLPLVDPGPEGLLLRVTVKGEVLTLRDAALARIRHDVLSRHKVNQGREAAERAVLHALATQVPTELDLDHETIAELIAGSAGFQMFLNAWWPGLQATDVLRRLDDPRVVAAVGRGILDEQEQRALTASYAATAWSVADTALLDELVALLGPLPSDDDADDPLFLVNGTQVQELVTTADLLARPRERDLNEDPQQTFAHLLIDEAQDITPMQWRMLRRRGTQASWTIVGDPAQSSWPDAHESERAIGALVGVSSKRTFRLSVNYRSPAEVFALAADVVRRAFPEADLPEAVRRTGIEPLLLAIEPAALEATLAAQLTRLGSEVAGTIGVIAPPSMLGTVSAYLAAAGRSGGRVSLVSPLQAKGLEYDAVIVVSPDDIAAESPGGVRVLYVALTRPTQQLVTIDLDPRGGAWRP
jgi:DNA helicase IV